MSERIGGRPSAGAVVRRYGRVGGVEGGASRLQQARGIIGSRDRSDHVDWKTLAPCVAYLVIEFMRITSMWPALDVIRPGWIVGLWALATIVFVRHRPIPRPLWYVFGLLALMVWHVPIAKNNRWALWGLETFAILVLGGVLPLAVLPGNLPAVRKLLNVFVLCHVPAAIHALLHKGFGTGGWLADENDLAMALVVALGVGIYVWLDQRATMWKLFLVAALGLFLAGVVASVSRGGFVGLVALGGYVLVTGPRRKAVAILAILAAVGFMLFAPPTFWKEVRSIENADKQGDTGEERLYYWGIAWRMYLDHPVAGVGSYNFGVRAPEYQDFGAHSKRAHMWGRVAHSLYFTLLAEQGTIGAVLFLAILTWSVRAHLRIRRAGKGNSEDVTTVSAALLSSGIMAGMVGFLVSGAFLSALYYPVFWVLVGLLASLDATFKTIAQRQPLA